MVAADRVEVYSDYVCPFCYLGRRSLEAYLADRDADLEVVWHPFDLRGNRRRPDGSLDDSVDDGKDDAYFDRVRENVERLKRDYGADEMRGIDDVPPVDSLDAQVASIGVRDRHPDRWEAFDAAVFEALWVDGRDVGEAAVLAELAEGVGVDPGVVREALGDDALRRRVEERFTEARRRGVTAVPTFVADGRAVPGAVPPEALARLVEGT